MRGNVLKESSHRIKLKESLDFTESESDQISDELRKNGICVIENYLDPDATDDLLSLANKQLEPSCNAGYASHARIEPRISSHSIEFHHPFLVSKTATLAAVNPSLIKIVEKYLGSQAVIHSSLFQKTIPVSDQPAIDWHIDCGSNKSLNKDQKFPDRRLRSIIYLMDVKDGGLGYIMDSRSALNDFIRLPPGALFPVEKIPVEECRRVEVLAPKGTLILFDTHGLHRPSPLRNTRTVLNTWYCKHDFPALLPPILIDLSNIPEPLHDMLYLCKRYPNFSGKICNSQKSMKEYFDKASKWLRKLSNTLA